MAALPGGITTADLHSLNGLGGLGDIGDMGMIFDASGHWIDPLRWRSGIHGLGHLADLETWPGSGGSSPLLDNPFMHGGMSGSAQHAGRIVPFHLDPPAYPGALGDLGASLTPGIHGLMVFPGAGGADFLVRNPIHPANAHAWIVGADDLGMRNKLSDAMASPNAIPAGDSAVMVNTTAGSNELNTVSALGMALHALGLAGMGCNSCHAGVGGMGDIASTLDDVYLSTGLDFSLSGSLIPGLSNQILYAAAGVGIVAFMFLEPKPKYSVSRRRNPSRKRMRARARKAVRRSR